MWANSNTNNYADWKSVSNGHSYVDPYSPGQCYTYSASFGYTDSQPDVLAGSRTDNNPLRIE